jgi:hypothetical protein
MVALTISACSSEYDQYKDLGNGYRIYCGGGYATSVVDSRSTQKIPGYILDYAFDSTFIIVAQSPLDSLPPMKFFIYTDSDRKKIALDKGVFRHYWIIKKKEIEVRSYDSIQQRARYSNIYGPYDIDSYKIARDTMGVSQTLRLINE